MIVERIEELCEEKGVSFRKFESESGLGVNTVKRWNTNAPSIWKVQMAAAYFGVLTSYLLGETDKKTAAQISDGDDTETLAIIRFVQSADPEQKAALLHFLKTFAQNA